ncbi:hypothetical protein H0N98_01440 [Candidatus Micrarchaeota archaeon]|nr:hypothetical protein [Candidatus Micrarchaeota archaeon]
MNKIAVKEEKPAMPGILKEDDLLERIMAPKAGEGTLFQNFKKEIAENLHINSGCMAFARKMCDDPDFYKFVEGALLEREKKGYKYQVGKDIYSFMETEVFNLRSVLSEISGKGEFRYDNLPSRILSSKAGYSDLKKWTETDYEVKQEYSALNELYAKHCEKFREALETWTLHGYVPDHKAAKFMISLLRTMWEKKLYEGEFKFADIGTGSGEFSDKFISFIGERFNGYKIVRTNPVELEIKSQKDLSVTIHDISKESLGEKFNLILIKDVMKFFERGEARGRIWENVRQSASEGSIVISGGGGQAFRPHVLYNNELIGVEPEAFLGQLKKVKNYAEYLKNLKEIVKNSESHIV